ncbi:hydrogen peroxide-inducible genes activator [Ruegeria profundi]|uniref:hydrogen peroxide-inducible genes activator n=1 Tax=Ruegeria profundi TaxID=1685378 RepID=UPI001CD7E1DC|nr:hydrogen peroxide-inducible genes activator [Ruegeria profundi]MCA0928073.1 LysR family transcriptional regulator [Ruegeria profundi]
MASGVTLKQLSYFVALTEAQHYRRAAERLGISQPSLSQQIAGLETTLGVELVERGQRGAILTPGGREILAQARRVLEETEALTALARDASAGVSGTIRLGTSPTLGPYFLPHVMRRLRTSYPSLKLIVRDAAPLVLQEELLLGQHDLILTQLPVRSADVAVERLFREPLKLAVAQDHALSTKSQARDADLAGQDILALTSSYALHNQIVALCEEVGANPRQDYEGTSLDALRQMTALNMGVCFLPALYVRSEVSPDTGDVAILSFRKDRFTRSVGLVWRKRSAHKRTIDSIASVIRSVARDKFAGLVTPE